MVDGLDFDVERFSWFRWLLGDLPQGFHIVKRRSEQVLGDVVENLEELKTIGDVTARDVRECVRRHRNLQTQDALRAIPIERLNDFVPGVRATAFRSAGFNTFLELSRSTESALQDIPGIGPKSARGAVEVMSVATAQVEGVPFRMPPPDEISPPFHGLLKALYRRVRIHEVPRQVLDLLEQSACGIATELKSACSSSSFWSRLFHRRATEYEVATAFQALVEAITSPATKAALQAGGDAVEYCDAPEEFSELVEDYRSRYADYISALNAHCDDVAPSPSPLMPAIPQSRCGGIPQSIADEVEQVQLQLDGLRIDLRRYQEFGIKYLVHQQRAILGDEMGLGKTIQALGTIIHESHVNYARHFVIVTPASTLGNWRREIEARVDRPELPLRLLHGNEKFKQLALWDLQGGIALTSYDSLRSVMEIRDRQIDVLIADEAHFIKNPDRQRSRLLHELASRSRHCILMTGTPLENRVSEFANLIAVCDERKAQNLSAQLQFAETAIAPSKFEVDVASCYLRRNQEDVLTELPDCVELNEWIELGFKEHAHYLSVLSQARPHITHMRMAANGDTDESSKRDRVCELVKGYRREGRKTVIFSQFLRTLDLIQASLAHSVRIDGGVPTDQRQTIIDRFDADPKLSVMLCQIDAGGVGINLQSASAVILVEPQWKPTTEWQAIKRVHRMGQSRRVVVHRLFARDTVDERIRELLHNKTHIFNEYARNSAIKDVSADATNSEAVIQDKIIESEQKRHRRQIADGVEPSLLSV